ncbi:MAG: MalY/PatB family protein [Nocardioidaceae bacterium]
MDNPLDAFRLEQLQRRTSMKWRAYPADVLPLWVAEMDVAIADPIVAAVTEAMERGDTGYAVAATYAEALQDFAALRWGWSFDLDDTAIVPDVMMGVVELLRLVTEPGDAVVVNPPVYPPFYDFITAMADRQVVEAPLGASHRLDLAVLEKAFATAVQGGRSAAYLLCSPHNPTGTAHTADELSAVAQLASTHGVRVIVDEIHAPLQLPGSTHMPYLSLPGTETAFSLMSASKAWNLAGLKAAMAVAGPEASTDLARMPEVVSHGPSHLGVIAHAAAYEHGAEWLDALLEGLDRNRKLLADLLAEQLPDIGYQQPEATFLAWLDCRELGLGDDPAAAFLERGRVALTPGPDFGTGGLGHVRLNLATSPDNLTEAVRRMAASL